MTNEPSLDFRVGIGFDSHGLAAGQRLVLGGVVLFSGGAVSLTQEFAVFAVVLPLGLVAGGLLWAKTGTLPAAQCRWHHWALAMVIVLGPAAFVTSLFAGLDHAGAPR